METTTIQVTRPKVVAMGPEHLVLIPKILESLEGTPHEVSFDMRNITLMKLLSLAIKFKNMIIVNKVLLNKLIVKITMHVERIHRIAIEDLIEKCKNSGMTVPIEICEQP